MSSVACSVDITADAYNVACMQVFDSFFGQRSIDIFDYSFFTHLQAPPLNFCFSLACLMAVQVYSAGHTADMGMGKFNIYSQSGSAAA